MAETITGIKITDLPEATQSQLTDTSVAVVDDGVTTRKTKLSTFLAWIKNKLIKNTLSQTATGYALDAYQGKVLNDKITELNSTIEKLTLFKYSEDGYEYLNTAKFAQPDGNESWIKIQKNGKTVEINARLKIITNFGQNTEYKLFDIPYTARGTQYGFAISNNTGKTLIVYIYGNKGTLYIKTGGNTMSTGDYLWINIDILCTD